MSQGSTAVGVGVVRVAVLSDTIKSVAFVALLVLLFLVNYLVPWVGGRHFLGQSLGFWRVAAWLVTLAIAIACFLLVGLWTKGRVIGILIDNRNMVSLSAMQAALWFFLIISALSTALISNVAMGGTLGGVTFPVELLAVMGLSLTSLGGKALILQHKANASPSAVTKTTTLTGAASARGAEVDALGAQGMVVNLHLSGRG